MYVLFNNITVDICFNKLYANKRRIHVSIYEQLNYYR